MSQILSRFSPSAIKNQISKIWKTVAIGILISLGGAGFTVWIAKLTDNPIWMLARDPAETKHFPPYIGMLSNWGVILWTATAVICLFSAVLLKQQKASACHMQVSCGIRRSLACYWELMTCICCMIGYFQECSTCPKYFFTSCIFLPSRLIWFISLPRF